MAKKSFKPTVVKKLEKGKVYGAENEWVPIGKMPDAPEDIDDLAKGYYKELCDICGPSGIMTPADSWVGAVLSQIRARLHVIHEFVKEGNKSLVQEVQKPDPDGGIRYEYKQSPYVVMEKQYMQLFRLYAKEFGLTPVGRVGLAINKGEGKNKIGTMID